MTEHLFMLVVFWLSGLMTAAVWYSRRSAMIFYTKNKGRTWWHDGREFRASELTDQLQNFYCKRIKNSLREWDFYDN